LRAVMRRNVKLIKENMEQNSKLISVMESDTISGTFSGKKTLYPTQIKHFMFNLIY